MDDLTPWLRAQLGADEARANSWYKSKLGAPPHKATHPGHEPGIVYVEINGGPEQRMTDEQYREAFYVPAPPDERLLREVEAKRQMLDEHADDDGRCDVCADPPQYDATWRPYPCTTVRLLALPYADRPGYREEWSLSGR